MRANSRASGWVAAASLCSSAAASACRRVSMAAARAPSFHNARAARTVSSPAIWRIAIEGFELSCGLARFASRAGARVNADKWVDRRSASAASWAARRVCFAAVSADGASVAGDSATGTADAPAIAVTSGWGAADTGSGAAATTTAGGGTIAAAAGGGATMGGGASR
ncbi:MAG: hypothetical protein HY255_06215 [Betaproteobacteria bacterium]|nr:hypothetical protein [Betaproteobacteria bacterium]